MKICLLYILASASIGSLAFAPHSNLGVGRHATSLFASPSSSDPQVIATGYSADDDMVEAIRAATELALQALPAPTSDDSGSSPSKIDLAVIFVSSLYDGTFSPTTIVPTLLEAGSSYGQGIQHVIGSTAGGIVGSMAATSTSASAVCRPVELEGTLGVSVSLFQLPDVELQTFHVLTEDLPASDDSDTKQSTWNQALGLKVFNSNDDDKTEETTSKDDEAPIFMVLPSPAFQNDLDDLLEGLQVNFSKSQTFGALASTVSSLSRARLFRYNANDPQGIQTFGDGCVGLAMMGDIRVKTMVAQGSKPVGGIYRVLQASGSTIKSIVLDETASDLERQSREAEEGEKDDDDEKNDEDDSAKQGSSKAQLAAAYAKASIPKPVLAEANFLMKTLSDDDQAFMKKTILVGLERDGSAGCKPSELARLRSGQGHRFEVQQVASAGVKDGSVTLPLGSVDVEQGTRMRFYVRDSSFAKQEVEALWTGFKTSVKKESAKTENKGSSFQPTGCFMLPTLDRGSKFFKGKTGFESGCITSNLPAIAAVSGFFSNGVVMKLDEDDPAESFAGTHGSATGYVLFGSKSGRPLYSPVAAAKAKKAEEKKIAQDAAQEAAEECRANRANKVTDSDEKAPRSEDGELVLKRREVHSGRALTVSTVEWSVAENQATASSTLEGFMWDKETEVDRFRERVPLVNLVSQCRLSASDPAQPKPRDWIGVVKQASKDGFVVIPECKRMEPVLGSLWKRYDTDKLAEKLTLAGAPAFSVNCDAVLFGGSQEDVTKVRKAAGAAALDRSPDSDDVDAPPVLASDLILYPYQLYQLSLAGADAVNLVGGALANKDLFYLTKIASSLKLQTLITITSEVQLQALAAMPPGSIDGVIISNRELEDFSFDMTGEQALSLLQSETLGEVREAHGADIPVFVEGRVGAIERVDGDGNPSTSRYLEEISEAGAMGVIVGGGLAEGNGYAGLREVASAL